MMAEIIQRLNTFSEKDSLFKEVELERKLYMTLFF